jgi:hypothetical protein
MATLHELWHAVLPGARLEGDASDRDVTWVRVMTPRVPAFPTLEPGDLAVVPEASLETLMEQGVEPVAAIDALAGAGISAVVMLGAGSRAGDDATAEVVRRGVPVLRLTEGEPGALERALVGYLVNARAELERQAATLEARLEALVLEGADMATHAAAISGFLGRPIAIEGPGGDRLAVHAPPDDPAAATAAARYLADARKVAMRGQLPARSGVRRSARRSPAGGALVLLGDRPPTELERTVVTRITGLLAIEMGRLTGGAPRSSPHAAGAVEGLPELGPPWVVLVGRQFDPDAPSPVPEREDLRRRLAEMAPPARVALRGDASSLELRLVVAAPEDDPLGASMAARIAEVAARVVVVSEPFSRPEDRAMAEAAARSTLDAVLALPRRDVGDALSARVVRAADLPLYRLIGSVPHLPDGLRHARALLAPLLAGRPTVVAERLATLRAVLDGPDLAAAAARLGVHRNTLAYRMGRIETATGWSLDAPELRFALALAVRLVQGEEP